MPVMSTVSTPPSPSTVRTRSAGRSSRIPSSCARGQPARFQCVHGERDEVVAGGADDCDLRDSRARSARAPRTGSGVSYENQPGVRVVGLCAHSSARGIQHQGVETARSPVDQTGIRPAAVKSKTLVWERTARAPRTGSGVLLRESARSAGHRPLRAQLCPRHPAPACRNHPLRRRSDRRSGHRPRSRTRPGCQRRRGAARTRRTRRRRPFRLRRR